MVSFPGNSQSEETQPLRWTAEMADQGAWVLVGNLETRRET